MTLYQKVETWNGLVGEEMPYVVPAMGKSTVSDEPRRKPHELSGRMSGYVKFYNLEKNFGFIRAGRDEYYVNRTALGPGLDYLVLDEPVQFDLGTDRAGRPVAKNVTLV
ncbi:Cold-shock DNA-binding domain protein [compost metagenome]